MLIPVVTALTICVMLLLIAHFMPSTWREQRRQMRVGSQQSVSSSQFRLPAAPIIRGPLLGERNVVEMGMPRPQLSSGISQTWYRRRRTLVSLGFFILIALALFVQSGLADGTFQSLGKSLSLLSNPSTAFDISTSSHSGQNNASRQLARISQLDPAQYSSPAQFSTWAYSACSAAAMTEVFDAYGMHLRITDVLQVEAQIGEITLQLGMVRPESIQNTAAQFGFQTTWGNSWTIDQVIDRANHGEPVIVSFPPDRYDGGHLLVVTGGSSTEVHLADSSLWNRRSLSRSAFLGWWEGYAAVMTPK